VDDQNPISRGPTRRTLAALGLGIGIAGVGATIADLYRKPAIAIGALVLGAGVAIAHLPWGNIFDDDRKEPS